MPELPEVETIIRELREKITGLELEGIESFRRGTVIDERLSDKKIAGKILSLSRRGKYIVIQFGETDYLLIHLRMTGKLIFESEQRSLTKHCRARIKFKGGSVLIFDDVRTFGKILIVGKDTLESKLSELGEEPFSESFDAAYLGSKIKSRKAPVKNLLLDQSIVAGLGNIYVCEILHRAGIAPDRAGNRINNEEIERIVKQTREVLKEALSKNGTTISDYRRIDEKQGEFQNYLRVYGKKECNCGSRIEKIKQSGRSTYYCPECQK